MEIRIKNFKKEERAILGLSDLYLSYGYKKYRVSRFEEYNTYLENKSFLTSDNIITFSGRDGKLLALKPDVTMSIVKNTAVNKDNTSKLFYQENVYRMQKESGEMKELTQMGVEIIGEVDAFAEYELTELALKSLAAIDENFILDVSHIGFVSGLLESFEPSYEAKLKLMELLKSKNAHGVYALYEQGLINQQSAEDFIGLIKLDANSEDALKQMQGLIKNQTMQQAYDEIKKLIENVEQSPFNGKLGIDFSIINDIGYYNGIIYQGFIEKLPKAVLFGGRYDPLLKKLGRKANNAVGFAIYLDELNNYYLDQTIVDAVLLYDESISVRTVANAVNKLREKGKTVLANTKIPMDVAYKKLYKVQNNGELSEVKNA